MNKLNMTYDAASYVMRFIYLALQLINARPPSRVRQGDLQAYDNS